MSSRQGIKATKRLRRRGASGIGAGALLALCLALVPAVAHGEVIVPHVGTPSVVTPHVEAPAPSPSEAESAVAPEPSLESTDGESAVADVPPAEAAGESSEAGAEPSDALVDPIALGCTGPTRCDEETPEEFKARRNREVIAQNDRLADLGFFDSMLRVLGPIMCPWYRSQRPRHEVQMQFWKGANIPNEDGQYEQYGVPPELARAIYQSLELQGIAGFAPEPLWCLTSVAP